MFLANEANGWQRAACRAEQDQDQDMRASQLAELHPVMFAYLPLRVYTYVLHPCLAACVCACVL